MVTILSIQPHYSINEKGRKIESFTVEFTVKKVIVATQSDVRLDGSLRFPVESPVINLEEISNKIINYLKL